MFPVQPPFFFDNGIYSAVLITKCPRILQAILAFGKAANLKQSKAESNMKQNAL